MLSDFNNSWLMTERLILRPFSTEDAPALLEILGDEEANTFLPWFPLKTLEQAQEHRREHLLGAYDYAVCLRENNTPIGYIGVSDDDSHDFGYGLRREFWHQGIMTEAARAVAALLKEKGIPFITATHDVNNPHSGEVMKKLGMTYRYSYREQWQPKNIPVVFRMYQLDLDGCCHGTYQKYWNQYPHFIEENL